MNPFRTRLPVLVTKDNCDEGEIPGRVCIPVEEGIGCFKKTRWIPEDEFHAYQNKLHLNGGSMRFFFNSFDIHPTDPDLNRRTRQHDPGGPRRPRHPRDRGLPPRENRRRCDTYNGHREWVPGHGWHYHAPDIVTACNDPDCNHRCPPDLENESEYLLNDPLCYANVDACCARRMPLRRHSDHIIEDLLKERAELLKECGAAKEKEHNDKIKQLEKEIAESAGKYQEHVEAMKKKWKERLEWGENSEWPWWNDGEDGRKLHELKRELRLRDLKDKRRSANMEFDFADKIFEVMEREVASAVAEDRATGSRRRTRYRMMGL